MNVRAIESFGASFIKLKESINSLRYFIFSGATKIDVPSIVSTIAVLCTLVAIIIL
jgi:hypothetical protein